MAKRKQFLMIPEVDPELKLIGERLKSRPVTEEELRNQRISFAFGNAPFDSDLITRESVARASKHIQLQSG